MIQGGNQRSRSIQYECSILTAIDVLLIGDLRYINSS